MQPIIKGQASQRRFLCEYTPICEQHYMYYLLFKNKNQITLYTVINLVIMVNEKKLNANLRIKKGVRHFDLVETNGWFSWMLTTALELVWFE